MITVLGGEEGMKNRCVGENLRRIKGKGGKKKKIGGKKKKKEKRYNRGEKGKMG